MTAARTLAEFAADLEYDQIPPAVVERAKACIIDTIAASIFGAALPWSRIVIDYVLRTSAPGNACIMGTPSRVQAPLAALANGVLALAFELDGPVHPSVGVHPGPGCVCPGLAAAQQRGKSGRELIVAFVAGFEAMHRLGDAAPQSSEKLGFHAPGLFGTFGGALTAGRLYGLNAEQMTNAIGIAGSLCSGLLEFSQSGGGMVKRLHPGRAAEGGVMAAELASDGFSGPAAVIEGKYGFLNVYSRDASLARVTAGLGRDWKTMDIAHKRYACHGTAHVPVTAALTLKTRHGITSGDIESIVLAGGDKIATHHNIPEPQEITTAQYSAPFCVALAFCRDPLDPAVFCAASVNDPEIRRLCRSVKVEILADNPTGNAKATRLTVRMKDGRQFVQYLESYPGMPGEPLTRADLRAKFDSLTTSMNAADADHLFTQLLHLEALDNVGRLRLH